MESHQVLEVGFRFFTQPDSKALGEKRLKYKASKFRTFSNHALWLIDKRWSMFGSLLSMCPVLFSTIVNAKEYEKWLDLKLIAIKKVKFKGDDYCLYGQKNSETAFISNFIVNEIGIVKRKT